jgi:excisionase family DNA binding protein
VTERVAEDVLTLLEAAAYLRVPEEEVLRLAEQREIPAQQIGGEWRFLKRALGYWLTYGSCFTRDFRELRPWLLGHPVFDELLVGLEKRLLQRIASQRPERGSKQAVGKHVGALKEEGDLDEFLASLSAIRAGKRGGGEE